MIHRTQTLGPHLGILDSELEDLRHNQWSIDCPNMVLKIRADKNPATYYGSGFISQDSEGSLSFKMYVTRERNSPDWEWNDNLKAGVIIPEYAYYDLLATDYQSRQWEVLRFIPNFSKSATGRKIINGKISSVLSMHKLPSELRFKSSQLDYWIFDEVKIPCNERTVERISVAGGRHGSRSGSRNAWKFRFFGIDFLLIKEQVDIFHAKIYKKSGDLEDYFEERFTEALEFVLGRPFYWAALQTRSTDSMIVKLYSKRPSAYISRFSPPLPPNLIKRVGPTLVGYGLVTKQRNQPNG